MSSARLPEGLGIYQQEVAELYDFAGQHHTLHWRELEAAMAGYPKAVGKGAECFVFKANNGQTMVKLPLVSSWVEHSLRHPEPQFDPEMIMHGIPLHRAQLEALHRAAGATGLEKLVAYNDSDLPSTVVQIAPGVDANEYFGSYWGFSRGDYVSIVDALVALDDRNLASDTEEGHNIMYHPEHGFTIIDYKLKDSASASLQQQILNFASKDVLMAYEPHNPAAELYRSVCLERFGVELAEQLDQQWHTEYVEYTKCHA
jgi:hypothetical protein